MIFIKNPEQIKKMQRAGRITGEALALAGEAVREGITTAALDKIIQSYIEKCGARPSFLGYGGFPGSACISINEEVIHGIPSSKRYLEEGDIVSLDAGLIYKLNCKNRRGRLYRRLPRRQRKYLPCRKNQQ